MAYNRIAAANEAIRAIQSVLNLMVEYGWSKDDIQDVVNAAVRDAEAYKACEPIFATIEEGEVT